jgi:hypothetical protein
MPKILDNGKFRVYVYANDDNPPHLPHCHVYWDGDDHASAVIHAIRLCPLRGSSGDAGRNVRER